MKRSAEQDVQKVASAFELIHGPVMARILPRLAGAMHGREMSFSQLTALFRVFKNGPQTISEIAEAADITHNAASRMVDRLVRAGLFTRTEDPDDRRQKRVDLTPEGWAFPPEMRTATAAAYAELLSNVPPDLLARLGDVMGELVPHLPPFPSPPGAARQETA